MKKLKLVKNVDRVLKFLDSYIYVFVYILGCLIFLCRYEIILVSKIIYIDKLIV